MCSTYRARFVYVCVRQALLGGVGEARASPSVVDLQQIFTDVVLRIGNLCKGKCKKSTNPVNACLLENKFNEEVHPVLGQTTLLKELCVRGGVISCII